MSTLAGLEEFIMPTYSQTHPFTERAHWNKLARMARNLSGYASHDTRGFCVSAAAMANEAIPGDQRDNTRKIYFQSLLESSQNDCGEGLLLERKIEVSI